MTYVNLVETVGWYRGGWVPKLYELVKETDKTLVVKPLPDGDKTRWDRRYHKNKIRFQLFDTIEEAKAAMPDHIREGIVDHQEAMDAERDARNRIEEDVKEMVLGDEWMGNGRP